MNVVLLVATIVVVVPLVAVDTNRRLDATLDHEETYFPFVVMSSVCLFVCALGETSTRPCDMRDWRGHVEVTHHCSLCGVCVRAACRYHGVRHQNAL